MNKELQKLAEVNERMKAKVHLMEKQMKTSDPVKNWKLNQQLQILDKPDSIQNYFIQEKFPPEDKTWYESEEIRYEIYKKSKLAGENEIDKGFVPAEIIKSTELSDALPPGSIYQGTKFIRNTYTRIKDEPVYAMSDPKSDYDRTSGYNGAANNASARNKRRFRRRANQINRTYVWALSTCRKAYGSEGSLNQHMKLKHPEYYHTADMPGRRRGRMGGRPLGFPGIMQPPQSMNPYRQFMH